MDRSFSVEGWTGGLSPREVWGWEDQEPAIWLITVTATRKTSDKNWFLSGRPKAQETDLEESRYEKPCLASRFIGHRCFLIVKKFGHHRVTWSASNRAQ